MAQGSSNGEITMYHHHNTDGDNMDTFLFTSESVGEGHPGEKSFLFPAKT